MVDAERNYEIYDKEMLAIIRALEDWRHFLEGLPKPFDIASDHQNLQYWWTAQDLSRRQACWSLYLSRFDFRLIHKPGVTNTQANSLSRIPSHLVTDANDNHAQTVLRLQHFSTLATASFERSNTLEHDIKQAHDLDPKVIHALQLLKRRAPSQLTTGLHDWDQHDGLIFYKGRIYIPKVPNLRKRILHLCHDSQSTEHPANKEPSSW